jgi:outer membrane receptor protein involved in Fe transport
MLGLTDARYDRTVLTANGQVVVDRGTVVGALPSVPAPWSGSVSVQYRWPMRANIAGYAEADDRFSSHNGGPFTENDPNSINYSPGFRADPAMNSLNMRLGFQRGPLDVRLWLSNALNSDPVLHLNSDVNGSTLYYAYTLRPRTLGLAATWKR